MKLAPADCKKILIVSAFAEPQSLGGKIVDELAAQARNAGIGVTVSDLYASHFDPVAFPDVFKSRANAAFFNLGDEQRAARLNGTLPPQVKAEQDKLAAADAVVFLCPVYFGGPPAIMKGWMEQVLTPGFAYDRGQAPMAGKKAMFAAVQGGRMGAASDAEARALTASCFQPLCDQGLSYCGFDVRPTLAVIAPPFPDAQARAQIVADTARTILQRLDLAPPAPAPPPPVSPPGGPAL